jgi:hypothetical protein
LYIVNASHIASGDHVRRLGAPLVGISVRRLPLALVTAMPDVMGPTTPVKYE